MSTMASRGALEPPKLVTAILGALMGVIASALLLVGGLTGLQQGAVLASVPFTVVIVLVAWCLLKALREDTAVEAAERRPAVMRPGRARARGRRGRAAVMSGQAIRRALGALLLAGALSLAACGETADEETSAGAGSAQPQGTKVRITLGTQGFPEALHPRRAVAAVARGQRLRGRPAQEHRAGGGPRPGAARRRDRRPRRLHRDGAVRGGPGGRDGPRPPGDLRPREGVLRGARTWRRAR